MEYINGLLMNDRYRYINIYIKYISSIIFTMLVTIIYNYIGYISLSVNMDYLNDECFTRNPHV